MTRQIVFTSKAAKLPGTYSSATGTPEGAPPAIPSTQAPAVVLAEQDFPGMNEEWLKWFPTDPPARQGAKLPVKMPGFKVSN